jgi:hypothetical protein
MSSGSQKITLTVVGVDIKDAWEDLVHLMKSCQPMVI